VAIYLKVIAVILFLGALSHLASILSISGISWASRPVQFRVADLVLLLVDLVVAWGLWRTRFWGVVGWVAAVVFLQFIPFLFFTDYFATTVRERATLHGLLASQVVLLGVFAVLLFCGKGRSARRPESS
jgi:hypothetical protein